jgi:hypothetical protein
MADLDEQMNSKDWVKLVEYISDNEHYNNVYAENFIYNMQVEKIPYKIFIEPRGSDKRCLYVRRWDINRATRAYDIVIN